MEGSFFANRSRREDPIFFNGKLFQIGDTDLYGSHMSSFLLRFVGDRKITVIRIGTPKTTQEITIDRPYKLAATPSQDLAGTGTHVVEMLDMSWAEEDATEDYWSMLGSDAFLQIRRRTFDAIGKKVVLSFWNGDRRKRGDYETYQRETWGERVADYLTVDFSGTTPRSYTRKADANPEDILTHSERKNWQIERGILSPTNVDRFLSATSVRWSTRLRSGRYQAVWASYIKCKVLSDSDRTDISELKWKGKPFPEGPKDALVDYVLDEQKPTYQLHYSVVPGMFGDYREDLLDSAVVATDYIDTDDATVNLGEIASVNALLGCGVFVLVTKSGGVYFHRFWNDVYDTKGFEAAFDGKKPVKDEWDASWSLWRLNEKRNRRKRPLMPDDFRKDTVNDGETQKAKRVRLDDRKPTGHPMKNAETTCWRDMCRVVNDLSPSLTHEDPEMEEANYQIWMIVKSMPPCQRKTQMLSQMRRMKPVVKCQESLSRWLVRFGNSMGVRIQ